MRMKGANRHTRGGDKLTRLNRIAMAADRRARSLPPTDPERAFHAAHSELALLELGREHTKRRKK